MPKMQIRDAVPGTLLRAKTSDFDLAPGEFYWLVGYNETVRLTETVDVRGRRDTWS